MGKFAVIVAAIMLSGVAQAAPGQELMKDLKACRAQADAAARLACFDALVSGLDAPVTAQAPVTKAPAANPPPPSTQISSKH